MPAARRFPPPWTLDEANDACFIVRDHNGQALAYVYFEDELGRRAAAKLQGKDEAPSFASQSALLRRHLEHCAVATCAADAGVAIERACHIDQARIGICPIPAVLEGMQHRFHTFRRYLEHGTAAGSAAPSAAVDGGAV